MRVDLITAISDLITLHGFDAVYEAVSFIGGEDNVRNIQVGDFKISKIQFNAIGETLRSGYKIGAIKMFRAITCCSLKEAKDVVEATRW